MNKRQFLKTLGLSGVALAAHGRLSAFPSFLEPPGDTRRKFWAWVTTDTHADEEEWKKRFALMRASGLNAILPEIYNSRAAYFKSTHLPVEDLWLDRILPLAKAEGLEVHAWMWSMPCNIEEVYTKHRDWYCVDRNGDSILDKTPYVPTYRFLCPSHPEAREFVRKTAGELCAYPSLDGVHFDYIRFPDVILPIGIQPRYGLKQDKEEPQYDYCYCDLCRADFTKETGIDIRKVDDPPSNLPWRQFRYDRITRLVNETLIPEVHAHHKLATAAVFPDWEIVRQEWPLWNLDAVLPMLYNKYYNGGIDWIGEKTRKGVTSMRNHAPLYSGLMIRFLQPDELAQAVEVSLANGAQGVVLFNAQSMTEAHWKSFAGAVAR